MYLFKFTEKEDIKKILNNKTVVQLAKEVGITRAYCSRVLNRWNGCSKFVAYAIVKCLDPNKEIEDFFERK